jgi:hypothetical protein
MKDNWSGDAQVCASTKAGIIVSALSRTLIATFMKSLRYMVAADLESSRRDIR